MPAKKQASTVPSKKQAPPVAAEKDTSIVPAKKQAATARTMSDSHKRALAEGREIGRAVRAYLEALDANPPQRGRRRTPASIQAKLTKLDDQIAAADPMTRVALIQERIDLQGELAHLTNKVDLAETEQAFVKVAKRYSELKGISYTAWREVGVAAPVLKTAGIRRSD